MCSFMKPARHVFSHSPHRRYTIYSFINCNTTFVVYLITCGCGKRYVGRTTRALKTRMQEHCRLIRKQDTNHPVSKHFTECRQGGINSFSFMGIERIIQKERGGNTVKTLDCRESFWIFTLNTRYPEGMNVEWNITHFLK
ncbi:hypothetical protein FKM82_024462 [Ascaphus truei]